MRLRYTPEAREDLRALKQYIAVELCNPSAADTVTQNIVHSCSGLKEQPYMGIELSEKTGRDTDLRYLVTGRHLVFYCVKESNISIMRILDSRTNYMQVLFGLNK